MTKEQLFNKYSINESHNIWDVGIDNYSSIEVYRLMHNGELPPPNDTTTAWIIDFLDKPTCDINWWVSNVMKRSDWGSLYLTAKRLVYLLHVEILKTMNK
jgi:hypothetical protein